MQDLRRLNELQCSRHVFEKQMWLNPASNPHKDEKTYKYTIADQQVTISSQILLDAFASILS
jgi:hypothetical protein